MKLQKYLEAKGGESYMFIKRYETNNMLWISRFCRHETQPKNGWALTTLLSTAQHCRKGKASCKHLSSLRVWVCVWCSLVTGASLRLYLQCDETTCNIRASGAPLQTQPYLSPSIPRGRRGARVAWTKPDKTSHRLAVSHPTRQLSAGRPSWERSIKAHVVFTRSALWVWPRQLRTTVWHYCDGNGLLRDFLPSC